MGEVLVSNLTLPVYRDKQGFHALRYTWATFLRKNGIVDNLCENANAPSNDPADGRLHGCNPVAD